MLWTYSAKNYNINRPFVLKMEIMPHKISYFAPNQFWKRWIPFWKYLPFPFKKKNVRVRRFNEGCHIWAVNMQKTIKWEQIHAGKTLISLSSSGHLDVVCLDVVILDKKQFLKCKQNCLNQIFLMMRTFCLMNLGKEKSKWRDSKNLLLCSLNLLSQKHYNISILLGCLLLEIFETLLNICSI